MSLAMLNVSSQGATRVRTFFDQVCPSLFRLRGPLCRDLGGSYAFHLSGFGGGDWVLDFDRCETIRGHRSGDLELWMSALDFEALISGKLDPTQALEQGRLRFTGDRDLFAHLSVFVAPQRRREREG
jgi:hypothetical protein